MMYCPIPESDLTIAVFHQVCGRLGSIGRVTREILKAHVYNTQKNICLMNETNCLYVFFASLGQFLGDIAIPDTNYSKQTKEEVALQEEVERYKKEVLEGLQIEEEGLTDLMRKKTKQLPTLDASRIYNDPVESAGGYAATNKNGQVLKNGFDHLAADSPINEFNSTDNTQSVVSGETNGNISRDISSTESPKRKHRKRHAINYHKKNRHHRRKSRYLSSCLLLHYLLSNVMHCNLAVINIRA